MNDRLKGFPSRATPDIGLLSKTQRGLQMASSHYSLDWKSLTIIVDSFLPMLNINTFTELGNSVIIFNIAISSLSSQLGRGVRTMEARLMMWL